MNALIAANIQKCQESITFSAAVTIFAENKYLFKTFSILRLMQNLGYTTSKVNKKKEAGFQRKPMTFCELTKQTMSECVRREDPPLFESCQRIFLLTLSACHSLLFWDSWWYFLPATKVVSASEDNNISPPWITLLRHQNISPRIFRQRTLFVDIFCFSLENLVHNTDGLKGYC